MATFRCHMSDAVVEYLGSLLTIYPAFWKHPYQEEWLDDITDALRGRDPTIKGPLGATKEAWIDSYKKGSVNAKEFWDGLSFLVAFKDLDPMQKIEAFWHAQTANCQRHLIEIDPHFDPNVEFWSARKRDIDITFGTHSRRGGTSYHNCGNPKAGNCLEFYGALRKLDFCMSIDFSKTLATQSVPLGSVAGDESFIGGDRGPVEFSSDDRHEFSESVPSSPAAEDESLVDEYEYVV